MPLIKVQSAVAIPENKKKELLSSLSKMAAKEIGKPEQYVMVVLEHEAVMFSGQEGNSAFAEVRSIGGLNNKVNGQIAKKLCALLKDSLGIPSDRVYINFIDVPAENWGWNGSTFG